MVRLFFGVKTKNMILIRQITFHLNIKRNLISAGTGSYNTGTAFGSGFLRGLTVWFFVLIICLIANGEGVCGIHMGGTGSVCIEGVGNTVDGAGGSCIHDTGRRIKVVGVSIDILETGLHLAVGSE